MWWGPHSQLCSPSGCAAGVSIKHKISHETAPKQGAVGLLWMTCSSSSVEEQSSPAKQHHTGGPMRNSGLHVLIPPAFSGDWNWVSLWQTPNEILGCFLQGKHGHHRLLVCFLLNQAAGLLSTLLDPLVAKED